MSAGAAGGAAIIVSAAWMFVRFSGQVPDAYGTAQLEAAGRLVVSDSAVWLGLYVVLAGILPIVFAILRWRSSRPAAGLAKAIFAAVLAGAAVGRVLMFAVGTRIPRLLKVLLQISGDRYGSAAMEPTASPVRV